MDNAVIIPSEFRADIEARKSAVMSITVNSPESRTEAKEIVRACKLKVKSWLEFKADSIAKALAAHRAAVAERDYVVNLYEGIAKTADAACNRYDAEHEEIRVKEQRRLQAIEDERARKERERLEREAARLKTPELKAERMEQAAEIVAPVVVIAPVAQKVQGESAVKVWKARVVNAALVPREWLIVDEQQLGAFARATKGTKAISGVEFYAETSNRMRV